MDNPLDLPPGEPDPAEQLAELRTEVEDRLEQIRNRPPARAVLFVDGPYHGTLRALPPSAPLVYTVPVPSQVTLADWGTPAPEATSFTTAHYERRRYAPPEVDGYATVDIWIYAGLAEPAYQETADAALRVLVRMGLLDHAWRDMAAERALGRTPGQQRPEIRHWERVTPPPPPPPATPMEGLAVALNTGLANAARARRARQAELHEADHEHQWQDTYWPCDDGDDECQHHGLLCAVPGCAVTVDFIREDDPREERP
jgi:hypothetical protein